MGAFEMKDYISYGVKFIEKRYKASCVKCGSTYPHLARSLYQIKSPFVVLDRDWSSPSHH